MFWFAFASLLPAVLIALACLMGGAWAFVALMSVTVAVSVLDRWTEIGLPKLDETRAEALAPRLSVALALVHFALLPLALWAITLAPWLNAVQSVALAFALGLFWGQIAHPNAHELIHRPGRWLRRLGRGIYGTILFGHHASAHLLVHHVHVATGEDPNSPRAGEGFYRFWPRAWLGSFRAGLRAEMRRHGFGWKNPYWGYCGGAVLMLALIWSITGLNGVLIYLAVATYAQMQMLLADYVQHYGLRRQVMSNGRTEPVGPRHSWNAPHWYSSAMMLNAPRHSDHHLHPGRSFPALVLDQHSMPTLPHPMPFMCALALFPPIWRRKMDDRAAMWRRQT